MNKRCVITTIVVIIITILELRNHGDYDTCRLCREGSFDSVLHQFYLKLISQIYPLGLIGTSPVPAKLIHICYAV